MPVNLYQVRRAVGAFNSCLHYEIIYSNIFVRKLDVLLISSAFVSIILTSTLILSFSKSFCFTISLRRYINIMNILVIRIYKSYMLVIYVLQQSADIEQNPGRKSNSCQKLTLPIIIYNWQCKFFARIWFILPAYCNLNLTPVFRMTMTIWKPLVMIYSEQNTHLILNEPVFVFII